MEEMRVGGYVRVSTQEQAKEGYSVPAQTERLRSYCAARGWNCQEIYTDPGYSGAKLERPALQRLISDVVHRNIDLVLVYKLDRLSRSQKDTLYLIEDVFLKNDTAFVSINENFDTSSAFGRAMIGILSVFAQLEREQIKERTQMGLAERAKSGLWHGGGNDPIGYDYIPETNELRVNEYEAIQVKEAFELFVNQHCAYTKIIHIFREKGYHNKHGEWKYSNKLEMLLSNSLYIGVLKWKGEEYPGTHPSLIDKDTFAKAQQLIQERKWRGKQNALTPFSSATLLSGMLYCGQCHGRYYGAGAYRGSKKLPYSQRSYVRIYMCYSRSKTKPEMIKDANCQNNNWKTEMLDRYIMDKIRALKSDSIIENLTGKAETQTASVEKRNILKKQIESIDIRIAKLLELYQLEGVPTEKIAEQLRALTIEKKKLESAIADLPEASPEISEETAQVLLAEANEILTTGSLEEQRSFAQTLIKGITLDGKDVTIEWAFR